jgi:Flp pilus assembly protein CpaB
MRASTLFILTVAVLLGLGVAVAAKLSGYFDPPAPPPVAAKADITVLVANRTLFAGDMIDPTWVRTRKLAPDEIPHYEANKEKYLPAVPQSVILRIAQQNIEADRPLLREHLAEMAKPDSLSHRLLPAMRAINLSLPKDRSAGGLIQVGEWVDVFLTTMVDVGGEPSPSTRTAPIAHKLRVISKRNGLWPVFAPQPDDKLVHFTLEANPYRATLIEFAKDKGTLSLAPISNAEQKELEEKRAAVLNGLVAVKHQTFSIDDSQEYAEEDDRVDGVIRGELSVNHTDLMRIFDITTPEPPLPKLTTAIQQMAGINRYHDAVFDTEGNMMPSNPNHAPRDPAIANAAATRPLVTFGAQAPKKECETCKKNKLKQQGQ